MGSPILNKIGLGNIDILYVIIFLILCIIALAVLLILQWRKLNDLSNRYERFMQGSRAKSLEKRISDIFDEQGAQRSLLDSHSRQLKDLYFKQQYNYQKMGLVKYDAFKEMGGKLSFCLVLLDEKNNGFLMNSVHSSDGCYSYTKRIKNGQSDLELSPEEVVALKKAVEE